MTTWDLIDAEVREYSFNGDQRAKGLFAKAIAAAEARGYARAREQAANVASSTACSFCQQPCSWDAKGGEARDGAWFHVVENERTAFHVARPLGETGAVERIRAMKDEDGA